MTDKTIIGICGYAGSGKDTIGNHLAEQYGFTALSFADSLKDTVCSIFNWDREMLEGRTPESRAWRETVDTWWAERLQIPHFTPRFAMTEVGSEVLRKRFCDKLWLFATEYRLNRTQGPVVFTDLRFQPEFEMVHRLGGRILKVVRSAPPQWEEIGIRASRGDTSAMAELARLRIHNSEWEWLTQPVDATIYNTGTIEQTYQQIDKFMK